MNPSRLSGSCWCAAWLIVAQQMFSLSFDPHATRLQLSPAERYGLFRESDQIQIRSAGHTPIRVMDLRGALVFEGKPTRLKLPRGHYFVETEGDRTQFAVLPDDYRGASFLGTDADPGIDVQHTQRLNRIQPAWARVMMEGQWATVRPQPNRWDWRGFDRVIEANRGRKILVQAFGRPTWLADDAKFVPEYTAYVRALAKRYRGKLYGIIIWNEPTDEAGPFERLPFVTPRNLPTFVRSYTTLLREATAVIRAVDPHVKIIGPAWQKSIMPQRQLRPRHDLNRDVFDAGGSRDIQVLAFHDYEMALSPPDQDTNPYGQIMYYSLDKRIANFRHSAGNRPIIVDELGLYGRSALGCPHGGDPAYRSSLEWHRGLCRAIKYVVMYRAAGVEAFIPHVLPQASARPEQNIEIGGWELSHRGPHPKTTGFLMACYWLDGARFIERRVINKKTFLYAWRRADGSSVVFAWRAEGQPAKLERRPGFRITDIYGKKVAPGTIGEEPVLFHGVLLSAVADMIRD